jgi:predicted GNAT family acetyltransferase
MTAPTNDLPADEMTVVDAPGRHRFELRQHGEVLGYADYRNLGDGTVEMPHTVISPQHRGRGLGEVLVAGAVGQLDALGVGIVPTCWFVADYLRRHPQEGRGEPR